MKIGRLSLYFGLNSIVTIVVIAAALFFFVGVPLAGPALNLIEGQYTLHPLWGNAALAIVAGVVATALYTTFGFYLLRWGALTRLLGDYHAIDMGAEGDTPEDWGTVTLSLYPMGSESHQPKLRFVHRNGDIVIRGEAHLMDNAYLVGHYVETGHTERRRAGAILYRKSGDGTRWEGALSYIDPKTDEPAFTHARWVRME